MKHAQALFLAAALLFSNMLSAEPQAIDGYDVLADVAVVRPLSFVGLLPITALATIPAPHKAIGLMAKTLVVNPAKYTFARPAGSFDYNK
ncbi:MAG: hypothetical protein M8364_13865 [Methylobacter sp.]|uniref:hypothetical protein n=1 Tax=Methylobacter sp. TaxID=2051955 RepID=UPI00258A8E6E|nr:hypothetical protein [Methylobacter sp.]MCL7421981.1 hypothetical protein [Methylobacter sp.]